MTRDQTGSQPADTAWHKTWGNREFIDSWMAKGGWQAPIREVQTQMVLEMLGHTDDQPIRVLDIGAGYGALAMAILDSRANATAVCLDASEAMLALGRERNAHRSNRIEFVQGSLATPAWLNVVHGNFDAIVSSRALHHFTDRERRRYIFREVFDLVCPGGCFINADNVRAATKSLGERYRRARDGYLENYIRRSSGGQTGLAELRAATPSTYHGPHNNGELERELAWLREAGFLDVDCFWKFATTVVYGGFRE